MLDPLYEPNVDLNRQLELHEIRDIVQRSKSGKATGIDELSYEVLKSENVIKLLHKLFLLLFDTNITPSVWRKAMNYRGISLQCVISKIEQETRRLLRGQ
jgi:hypothetical protein